MIMQIWSGIRESTAGTDPISVGSVEMVSPVVLSLLYTREFTLRETYECNECGKAFVGNSPLLRHQENPHWRETMSVMSVAKSFGRTFILVSISAFTQEKPYSCKIWGKPSISVQNLTRHQRVHSEVKP